MQSPLKTRGVWIAFLLSCLVSCGGSSGSTDSSTTPPTYSKSFVLVDRSAGTADVATAVVSGVVYEDMTGRMTENLLETSTELFLTNAGTQMSGLSLREAPRATYRAMHIIFVPGSHTVRWKAGGWDKIQAPSTIKATFKTPVTIAAGDWILLRHARPVSFVKDQLGNVHWDLDLVPDYRSGEVITGARIKVLHIEAQKLAAWGEFQNISQFIVRMQFSDKAILTRDEGIHLTAQEFVSGLRIGTELLVDGLLLTDRELEVIAAEDLTWPNQPNTNQGVKTKVYASIDSITLQNGSMSLHVLQVLRHGRGPLPPRTLVAYGEQAKIKWKPHHNQTPKHVPFSALKKGMLIEAEWKTPEKYGTAVATKIRIKSDA